MSLAGRLRIEPVTDKDVKVVLDLIRGLAEYERMSHLVVATEDDLRQALFAEPRTAEAVIASLEGRPVGYALWFYTFSTFLGKRGIYLEDLFVLPDSRGHGIGRALITHLARIAIVRGCPRIEWSVLNWNESAIRFYDDLGATPVAEWTVYRLTNEALSRLSKGSRP
jgi:GNAT superfamily N-acetyltransferase